jgi:LmbE family N-acetylglucosaminyl deacetylase
MEKKSKEKEKKKDGESKESILVFCAHSDDHIFGVGGTMAKYAKEGADIHTVIVYYGEGSHPWLKRKVTVKMRVKEAQKADKVIGGAGVVFLGLKEHSKDMEKKIRSIIRDTSPTKVFTHAADDPHPEHRIVLKMVLDSIDKRMACDVYSFDIWNPLDFRKREHPKMYVDITDTFKTKLEALECFPSQWLSKLGLMWRVYASAIINGWKNNCEYAERFYKVR